MPIAYKDSFGSDMNAIASMGNTAGGIAYALPQLQWQADRMRQEMMLQRAREILLNAQTRNAMSQAGYHQAQQTAQEAKTKLSQDTAHAGELAGQALTLSRMMQNPDMNNPVVRQSIMQGMQSGMLPSQGFEGSRTGLSEALNAIAMGNAMRNAVSAPSGAASVLAPHNIPQGGTGMSALGTVGVGQPKPMILGQNDIGYLPNQEPQYGATVLNRGQDYFLPGQQLPFAKGEPFPPVTEHQGNLWPALLSAYNDPNSGSYNPEMAKIVAAAMANKVGITNAPPTVKLPTVTTKQQFDSLPKGAQYIGRDGKTYQKP